MHARLFAILFLSAAVATVPACNCASGTGSKSCVSSADCPEGQDCVDRYCRPPCTSNEDCPGDRQCLEGYCEVQAPAGCADRDGDGYGMGCPAGADCDDSDPTQTGNETCDEQDNDCDGRVDEGVQSPCRNCDPSCEATGLGGGTGMSFDPESADSDGVGLDDEGALVLDSERVNTNFIWIANTPEATVSKFDTDTYEEQARYRTGPIGGDGNFSGDDPSRTSVNTLGDVYVANRNGNSVTRISVLGDDCADADSGPNDPVPPDGRLVTSSGGDDVRPWGQDDCVLWHQDLDDDVYRGDEPGNPERRLRAVAAQDVEGPDGELRQYVWAGGYQSRKVAKLDGETGEVLFVTDSPVKTYGFAFDADGQLWIATREGHWLGRIDTTRCTDAASCAVDVCTVNDGDPADKCDGRVKAKIASPELPYGVTVDFEQRVWLGGGDVMRYDPDAPDDRWQTSGIGFGSIAVHGIAADAEGWVWGAAQENGIVRIDADDPTRWEVVENTEDTSNKGMAVDADGKIWSITQENRAVVIMPGDTIGDASVNRDVARSINDPYTYSDMTGLQLRLATNPRGYYRHVVEGCPGGPTPEWGQLEWEAETPAGTSVLFRVRVAETRRALARAEWVPVATQPPDESPASIGDALEDAGVTPAKLLMLEIVLRSERADDPDEIITPRVLGVNVERRCPASVE